MVRQSCAKKTPGEFLLLFYIGVLTKICLHEGQICFHEISERSATWKRYFVDRQQVTYFISFLGCWSWSQCVEILNSPMLNRSYKWKPINMKWLWLLWSLASLVLCALGQAFLLHTSPCMVQVSTQMQITCVLYFRLIFVQQKSTFLHCPSHVSE